MYSRKQFLTVAAMRFLELIRTCNSILSCHEDESDELSPKSIFIEAMRLGIDPGTLDKKQLLQAVNDAREQH
jgi:hypothetical protein